MLVLTRKRNEELIIAGNVRIRVLSITRGRIRLGVEAPAECSIRRSELTPSGSGENDIPSERHDEVLISAAE